MFMAKWWLADPARRLGRETEISDRETPPCGGLTVSVFRVIPGEVSDRTICS